MSSHTNTRFSVPRIIAIFALIFTSLLGSFGSASAQNDPCRLDKVSTANEIEGAGLQRMEVGGGGVQHVDYYVPGLDAVSYIVGEQDVPMIWWGFGSIWEGNGEACEGFDWVTDTQRYAEDRLDSGHSGVVVDLRDGQTYNVGSLNQSQVDELLAAHKAAINTNVNAAPSDVNQDPANCTEDSGIGGLTGCSPDGEDGDEGSNDGQQTTFEPEAVQHDPATGPVEFTVEEGGAVYFQFWSNSPGVDQAEHRVLITEPGDYSLNGGGTYFVFPAGHADEAQAMFDEDERPVWTLAELEEMGLVN